MDVTRVVLGDPAREPLTVPAELHVKLKQGCSINQKVDVLCDGVSETQASVRVCVGGVGSPVQPFPRMTQLSTNCTSLPADALWKRFDDDTVR